MLQELIHPKKKKDNYIHDKRLKKPYSARKWHRGHEKQFKKTKKSAEQRFNKFNLHEVELESLTKKPQVMKIRSKNPPKKSSEMTKENKLNNENIILTKVQLKNVIQKAYNVYIKKIQLVQSSKNST